MISCKTESIEIVDDWDVFSIRKVWEEGNGKGQEDREGGLTLCILLITCINIQHIDCHCIKRVIYQLSSLIVDFYYIMRQFL